MAGRDVSSMEDALALVFRMDRRRPYSGGVRAYCYLVARLAARQREYR
jgi:hypothetical protein